MIYYINIFTTCSGQLRSRKRISSLQQQQQKTKVNESLEQFANKQNYKSKNKANLDPILNRNFEVIFKKSIIASKKKNKNKNQIQLASKANGI